MGAETKIEWCHHTFNPWRGCDKVNLGCTNCYAETNAKRNPAIFGVWGANGTRVIASEAMWREPIKWNKAAANAGVRRRVFCASLADVFEDRPDLESPRWRLFRLIQATPDLDWLLLTKRPAFAAKWLTEFWAKGGMEPIEPLPNVWIGTSVSDQETADRLVPELLGVPAAVRFLSVEPLLGPVDLTRSGTGREVNWLYGPSQSRGMTSAAIDWVIVGGESGPKARPCDVAWIRSVVEQCKAAGVPVFVEQLGARPIAQGYASPVDQSAESIMRHGEYDPDPIEYEFRDRKGGEPSEWPKDLRVREFPVTA